MTKNTKGQMNFGMSLENMNEAVLFVEGKLIACWKSCQGQVFYKSDILEKVLDLAYLFN
jgi:hypothetical protein